MKINSINSYNQNKNSSISKSQNKQNFGLRISPEVEHDIYQAIKGCDIGFWNKTQAKLDKLKSLRNDNCSIIKLSPLQKFKYGYENTNITDDYIAFLSNEKHIFEVVTEIDEELLKNADSVIEDLANLK